MNLSQMQTLMCSWLDDPYQTYFTPAQTLVWLNNAQREVQKQLIQAGENFYVQRVSGSTITYQDVYALPIDLLKLHKLEIVLNGVPPNEQRQTLSPKSLVQIDQVSTAVGIPSVHCFKRNVMILRPIPDNIYLMYLNYSYRIVDMALGTDVPDVPQDYHEYIAVLATIDGFLKDQRDPTMFITEKREKYLALMKQSAQERAVDSPRMVIENGYDMGVLF